MARQKYEIYDEAWVPTQCGKCFSNCGIRVRRVNGVAVQIEGNEDSWQGSRGGVCGKGAAGLQLLYDPNRLTVPLRRTNPEKGLYVDPQWKEISWDEALDEIAEKLKKALGEDPGKIFLQSTTVRSPTATLGFRKMMKTVLGTPNDSVGGAGLHCGNGLHHACGLMHGSWDVLPDYKYCNYAIYWGVNNGHATGHASMVSTRLVAEAVERGLKIVVFDPLCNYSGAKASEWIPIVPGTDGAVILAMCNVILNELGIYDSEYLKTRTNGPYLVGPDGQFVRDKQTGKPLVYDPVELKPKVYDDPGIGDFALVGTYEIHGVKCHPAFQLMKDHLKEYTPQMASKVSTVPAETIRRIATEFATAAQVGSTITIDDHELPYRPAAATMFRGGQGHGNAFHTCMTMCLLNHILGAADVPGGAVGLPSTSLGYPETGRLNFGLEKGPDGMLSVGQFYAYSSPWPVKDPKFPTDAGLRELFPLCSFSPVWAMKDREKVWQKIGLPNRIEVMLNFGCNSILGMANPKTHAEFLKKIPFIVSWDLFANEFSEGFADILLPDTSYLETFTWLDGQGFSHSYPWGMDPWCCHITQPVVKPLAGRRYILDTCFELLDRVGKREALNAYWNNFIGLKGTDRFQPDERVTWEQVGDKALKTFFGPQRGLEWFKEHGFISWPKKVEEAYWRCFTDARVPIYMEFMVDMKAKLTKIAGQIDIQADWDQYTPLISWFPCAPHKVKAPQYDLYCFSYRDTLHTASASMEQPWLDEASKMNPYTYNISMSSDMAKQKGLKDGDLIEVQSIYGHTVRGKLTPRKGQHPQTLGIAGTAGHWAKGQPIAKGKGTNCNFLIEATFENCDPVSLNLETCVKVKVNKVPGN